MFSILIEIIERIRARKHIVLNGANSLLLLAPGTRIKCGKGSKIVVNDGTVRIGFQSKTQPLHSHYQQNCLFLDSYSTLQFNGDVSIAAGATLRIENASTCIFEGNNIVSYNFLAICRRLMHIGRGACCAWNVTLVDDDLHRFQHKSGKSIALPPAKMIIENDVGIQMNVVVPRGVRIGKNAVVAAGTVLRQNVPENCTV